jgi:hypothetical protein
MTELHLTKHHGLGNDFLVLVDGDTVPESHRAELAVHLCHRHTGIGADGLLFVLPSRPEPYVYRPMPDCEFCKPARPTPPLASPPCPLTWVHMALINTPSTEAEGIPLTSATLTL